METYIIIFILFGLSSFGMAFMPAVTKLTKVSYSVYYVAIGIILYLLMPDVLPSPLPTDNPELTVHLTEIIVIVSLMGTAIKIDRSFSFKKWASPLKLVGIAMLACIITSAVLGYYILEFALSAALLLGAVLAPTDPVLAAEVQVGPPLEDEDANETKFSLTAEAGLNDGMAFPFTWLAIVVAMTAVGDTPDLMHWFGYHVIYKIIAGMATGWLMGKLAAFIIFDIADKYDLLKSRDGFLAISLTLITYGLTEAIHGYGFLAVFVAGYSLRHAEKGHEYHEELHSFSDQVERILLAILLIFLGGTLVSGILDPLTWEMALIVLVFLLVVRPLFAWLALAGSKMRKAERFVISLFGVRGMGTVFYLAYAFRETEFDHKDELWAIAAFTILLSVIFHGFTATSAMERLEGKEATM
jgi:NhaP-type Na+/H+ or K+/H+ antiporter